MFEMQQRMQQQAMEEERFRAEEHILNTHLEAVKEEAQLIQREGEMITSLEQAIMNDQEYEMRDYLADARQIAIQKIQMYQQLMSNIDSFQSTFYNNSPQKWETWKVDDMTVFQKMLWTK